jgi:tRNA-splicing ligase RtcB
MVGNVMVWGDIEQTTIDQAQKAASLPILEGHLALMPDAHIGIGATIGSVIPTLGAVIPAAVGVDIGCGVAAIITNLREKDLPSDLTEFHGIIASVVPAGMGQGHDDEQPLEQYGLEIPSRFDQRQRSTALRQFGSLGGGNHFVEVCLDEEGRVVILLHSGSRGIGNQLATKHVAIAKDLFARPGYSSYDLPDPDLAWLTEGTPQFDAYIEDMTWAQAWAYANRSRMLDNIMGVLAIETGRGRRLDRVEEINNHHNFTRKEFHQGDVPVWITRKGAIPAALGRLGIIPGSMGTRSYIVEGLGNPDSYCSCSHGAGRRMSRGQARRELSPESLTEAMIGRIWNTTEAKALVDEHPLAYKDIGEVMEAQSDLVVIRHTLRAVLNYKGVDRGRKHS